MVSKKTVLNALLKIQDKLSTLEAQYLTSKKMSEREYLARKTSLKLAFNKLKNDVERMAGI